MRHTFVPVYSILSHILHGRQENPSLHPLTQIRTAWQKIRVFGISLTLYKRELMNAFFTNIASAITNILHVNTQETFGTTLHYFLKNILEIFFLLYVIIFIIALFRAQLSHEKVKEYLNKTSSFRGYLLAIFLGIVTPFCSCSSIPLFIGFIRAQIPFGIAMTFLIASPLVSEIATLLLISIAGIDIAILYVLIGSSIALIAGYLCDTFNLQRYLTPAVKEELGHQSCCSKDERVSEQKAIHYSKKELILYAHNDAMDIIHSTWIYVILGIFIGSFMYGYIPDTFFTKYLGADNLLAVPFATLIGIPLYAGHTSIIPVITSLLDKGVPIGTAMAVLMSTTAISLPELIILKRVLSLKMIIIFTLFMFISFIFIGWILNAFYT
ncbi:MAG: permease [Desulfovibrionaceae bacterium]